jgi:hypothetical protein
MSPSIPSVPDVIALRGVVRRAGHPHWMAETRLADVPAPRWLVLWVIGAWLADTYGRIVIRRAIGKAIHEDVIPSTQVLAQDIADRRKAADAYAEEMKTLNERMVKLNQRMVGLTWAVVFLTIVAAGASVAALVVAVA